MKKLLSKKGFTLAEMLIAVLLLGFVSVMVAVMSSAVLNSTFMIKEVAQAEILGSEALDNVQNELRFALNVKIDNNEKTVTFDPDRHNQNYHFGINDEGMIVLHHTKDGSDVSDLLFSGVSYGNLKVDSLEFSASGTSGVSVSVSIAYGKKILWSGSAAFNLLNGVTTT